MFSEEDASSFYYEKERVIHMTLKEFFEEIPKAAVAFSGGTDSALVLWAARKYGCDVRAYYARTAFQPEFEWQDARRLAAELEVPLKEVPVNILEVPEVRVNGPKRCYYCKQALFNALWEAARADGYHDLLDGTNASDDAGDRPGMAALRELKVRSPLRECGVTKQEVRRLSREAGLFTWDKPAYACLATRIPTGRPIGAEDLVRIEEAENALSRLGFSDFRVRLLDGAARLQVTEKQTAMLISKRKEILTALRPYFSAVLLDLESRNPSM